MKERPILFSGEMVRAIIDGRKTQTRRVVKPPKKFPEYSHCDPFAIPPAVWWWNGEHKHVGVRQECPFGIPGDRLWLRENFQVCEHNGGYDDFPEVGYILKGPLKDEPKFPYCIFYAADEKPEGPIRPSIHMPRWASRITLEITGVRVERLESASDADIKAEGFDSRDAYERTMVALYGTDAMKKWAWGIEFKRVER